MKHKAKIDWWIGGSIIIDVAVPFVVAATLHLPWICGVAVGGFVLVFGFCYPQWYEATPAALVIRAAARLSQLCRRGQELVVSLNCASFVSPLRL